MTRCRWSVVALGALLLGGPVVAQVPTVADAPMRQRSSARPQLERNLRQAMWRATKTQVGLSDAQMDRLEALTRRLEPQRAALLRREREARRSLRVSLQGAQPDQSLVSKQLDEIHAVQRARVELFGEEHRRLGEFMTPVQRARYFALQEQFRRRIEQLRRPAVRPGAADSQDDDRPAGRRRRP